MNMVLVVLLSVLVLCYIGILWCDASMELMTFLLKINQDSYDIYKKCTNPILIQVNARTNEIEQYQNDIQEFERREKELNILHETYWEYSNAYSEYCTFMEATAKKYLYRCILSSQYKQILDLKKFFTAKGMI